VQNEATYMHVSFYECTQNVHPNVGLHMCIIKAFKLMSNNNTHHIALLHWKLTWWCVTHRSQKVASKMADRCQILQHSYGWDCSS